MSKLRRRRNLLVVDWDTFFYNPFESGKVGEHALLYDWSHRESPFFVNGIWTIRASTFIRHQLALPQVEERWRTFAARFTFRPRARLFYADSNAWAGLLAAPEHVWLYDAHHDCGYKQGETLTEWIIRKSHRKPGEHSPTYQFDCGDWMLLHKLSGAELHHRFPKWRKTRKGEGVDYSMRVKDVPLDGRVDDPANDPTEAIDDVFVCRSGAWVPPWCDGAFVEFLATFPIPVTRHTQMDREPMLRPFDRAVAEQFATDTATGIGVNEAGAVLLIDNPSEARRTYVVGGG